MKRMQKDYHLLALINFVHSKINVLKMLKVILLLLSLIMPYLHTMHNYSHCIGRSSTAANDEIKMMNDGVILDEMIVMAHGKTISGNNVPLEDVLTMIEEQTGKLNDEHWLIRVYYLYERGRWHVRANPFIYIKCNDIESINVLKNADAIAICGSNDHLGKDIEKYKEYINSKTGFERCISIEASNLDRIDHDKKFRLCESLWIDKMLLSSYLAVGLNIKNDINANIVYRKDYYRDNRFLMNDLSLRTS